MKVGDLVSPQMTCAGKSGDVRCQTSIVVDVRRDMSPSESRGYMIIKIHCACNKTVWVPKDTLELINENRRLGEGAG